MSFHILPAKLPFCYTQTRTFFSHKFGAPTLRPVPPLFLPSWSLGPTTSPAHYRRHFLTRMIPEKVPFMPPFIRAIVSVARHAVTDLLLSACVGTKSLITPTASEPRRFRLLPSFRASRR